MTRAAGSAAAFDRRDDGLRSAQRAGPAARACRDPSRAEAGRRRLLARLRPARIRVAARDLSRLSHGRRSVARLGAASRSRHVSLHSRVDSAVSRRARRRRADASGRVSPTCGTFRCCGGFMAIHVARESDGYRPHGRLRSAQAHPARARRRAEGRDSAARARPSTRPRRRTSTFLENASRRRWCSRPSTCCGPKGTRSRVHTPAGSVRLVVGRVAADVPRVRARHDRARRRRSSAASASRAAGRAWSSTSGRSRRARRSRISRRRRREVPGDGDSEARHEMTPRHLSHAARSGCASSAIDVFVVTVPDRRAARCACARRAAAARCGRGRACPRASSGRPRILDRRRSSGCSTVSIISRATICGSASASAIERTAPHGTPAARSARPAISASGRARDARSR